MSEKKEELIAFRMSREAIGKEYGSAVIGMLFGPIGMLIEHIVRTRTPYDLIYLKGAILLFGKKRQEIRLQDIETISLRYNESSLNGSIIIKTKVGKKAYKQKYVENIHLVESKIRDRIETLGLLSPVVFEQFWGGKMKEKLKLSNIEKLVGEAMAEASQFATGHHHGGGDGANPVPTTRKSLVRQT